MRTCMYRGLGSLLVLLSTMQMVSWGSDSSAAVQDHLRDAPSKLFHADQARLMSSAYGWLKADKVP